jgi:hypothetical protein
MGPSLSPVALRLEREVKSVDIDVMQRFATQVS